MAVKEINSLAALEGLIKEATLEENLSILAFAEAKTGRLEMCPLPSCTKGCLKRAIKILRIIQPDFPPEKRPFVDEAVKHIRRDWMQGKT